VSEQEVKRKLAAILSADAAGYSRLMADDEAATVRTITAYREVMTARIRERRGRVLDAKGDNLLAEFSSVIEAVQCGLEIQAELGARNARLPEGRRLEFRIGINLGDVIEDGGTIYGDGVNVAARLEGLADPGGLCLSRPVYEQVRNRLAAGFEYLGECRVKNIAEPIPAYRVLGESRASAPRRSGRSGRRRGRLRAALVLGAVLLAGAGLVVWNHYLSSPRTSVPEETLAQSDKASIAVLPFNNLSGDPKEDYLADGVSEEIITALSKVPGMDVIARNSAFTYKGQAVKVQQVAEDLGVRYVLEGSIQKAGGRVRINAQLVDAASGRHLWAERYDRELRDLFALQDDITFQIIRALQVKLTEGEQARLLGKGARSFDAYAKVLQAREEFYRMNREGNARSRQLAEEAIALEPGYAGALAMLALNHMMDLWFGFSQDPRESLALASRAAHQALSLDENDLTARVVLCYLYVMERRHDEAVAAGENAVALSPSGAGAHAALGSALYFAGRPKEALASIKRAISLNPFPPAVYLRQLGLYYSAEGRFEEAVPELKKTLDLSPNDLFAHLALARACVRLGRLEEARAEAAEIMRIYPKFSLEYYARTNPLKDEAELERQIGDLREAGLK